MWWPWRGGTGSCRRWSARTCRSRPRWRRRHAAQTAARRWQVIPWAHFTREGIRPRPDWGVRHGRGASGRWQAWRNGGGRGHTRRVKRRLWSRTRCCAGRGRRGGVVAGEIGKIPAARRLSGLARGDPPLCPAFKLFRSTCGRTFRCSYERKVRSPALAAPPVASLGRATPRGRGAAAEGGRGGRLGRGTQNRGVPHPFRPCFAAGAARPPAAPRPMAAGEALAELVVGLGRPRPALQRQAVGEGASPPPRESLTLPLVPAAAFNQPWARRRST